MLQIDSKILSRDIIEKCFCCDINKCKGNCCIHGDSGAPLEEDEAISLKNNFENIRNYITMKGLETISKQGISMIDSDGDVVTPLIDGKECAYVVIEKGIARCSIENAYKDGKINFQKPISCHLYPIRIKKYKDFDGLNYDEWDICKPATVLGKEKQIKIYEFAKDALVRKYGLEWWRKLRDVAEDYGKSL